ncbi:MAG: hypothetical protein H7Z43_14960 [Clostridia bacterium]|nr:hypothetical protein [Deltaproteobacteria bacterium]
MTSQIEQFAAKLPEASRLRARKYALVRKHSIPENLIGGSLVVSRRRCGKSGCRCAGSEGHSQWSLTSSYRGDRRVERIDAATAVALEEVVLATRVYMDALKEVMAINMELLALTHREKKRARVRGNEKKSTRRRRNDQQTAPAIDLLNM